MEEKETVEENSGKKKILRIGAIIGISIAFVFLIMVLMTVGYTKIYNGVRLNGISLGGKTVSEAVKIIENEYEDVSNVKITLACEGEEIEFTGAEIGAKMNALEAARFAYEKGREGGFFGNIFRGISNRISRKYVEYNISYDRLKMDNQITKITKKVEKEIIQPSYIREGGSLIVKNGVTGRKAEHEKILKEILQGFSYLKQKEIDIQLKEIAPEKVDIDKIQKDIKKIVKNAEYLNESGVIVDQVIGLEIKDVEEAKKIAESVDEEGMQFSIELLVTLPETTTENVLKELFKDELSIYTTYFNVNEKERTENVKLAAAFIDDVILMPGQEFSYNTTVGERSVERGFKTAKVYQEGAVVDGLGGGICQVSSTLYNAAVMADLEITERRNHSLSVSYVKLGRDATVVYGVTDFKFKNNQQYPVKIESDISGGMLTVRILGIDTNKSRSVDIRTETIAVLPFAVKEIIDDTLTTGMRVVSQAGKKGYKVISYRVTKENGVLVEEKKIATDTYSPVAEIIKVGPTI